MDLLHCEGFSSDASREQWNAAVVRGSGSACGNVSVYEACEPLAGEIRVPPAAENPQDSEEDHKLSVKTLCDTGQEA